MDNFADDLEYNNGTNDSNDDGMDMSNNNDYGYNPNGYRFTFQIILNRLSLTGVMAFLIM